MKSITYHLQMGYKALEAIPSIPSINEYATRQPPAAPVQCCLPPKLKEWLKYKTQPLSTVSVQIEITMQILHGELPS